MILLTWAYAFFYPHHFFLLSLLLLFYQEKKKKANRAKQMNECDINATENLLQKREQYYLQYKK